MTPRLARFLRWLLFAASLLFCVAYDILVTAIVVVPFLLFDALAWSWGEAVDWRRYGASYRDGLSARWWRQARRLRGSP